MLDTHAVARALTDAEFTPAPADAITNAVRLAAEQGDHVTSDQFKAGLAIRWMVGTVLATGGLTFAILRFLGCDRSAVGPPRPRDGHGPSN